MTDVTEKYLRGIKLVTKALVISQRKAKNMELLLPELDESVAVMGELFDALISENLKIVSVNDD